MEMAKTSSALNLFPTRFKIKRVGCKFTDFSDVSLLTKDPQILSRRDGENGAMVAPKKRQNSDEANPPKKRQKKTMEVNSTTKAKSIRTLKAKSLDKIVSQSKQETKTKVTKPVDARSITSKVTPKPSYETETKKPDLRNLIAKAQHKIQEKRQIDHRQVDIANQRIAARLALDQMVATVEFNEHLKHHVELEQYGCTCSLHCLSRSDYIDESNYSVLENNNAPRCDEDSTRKKHQRSRKDKSMKHSSEDLQITNNGGSAESYNQRRRSVRSSKSVRIQ